MKKREVKELLDRSKNQKDMFPSIPSSATLTSVKKPRWKHRSGDTFIAVCDYCSGSRILKVTRVYADMMKARCGGCGNEFVSMRPKDGVS